MFVMCHDPAGIVLSTTDVDEGPAKGALADFLEPVTLNLFYLDLK